MSTFRAGGLASGIDSNTLIDQLVKLESRPIDLLRTRQAGMKTQISTIGDLVSKLSSFQSAVRTMSDSGTLGTKISSTHESFSATSSPSAVAGSYNVRVDALAKAAVGRSQSFTSATAPVKGGTLTFEVMGKTYDPITIPNGSALSDIPRIIRTAGIPVSAAVVNDGTNYYLQFTNQDTGVPDTGNALRVVENTTGGTGQALTSGGTYNLIQTATNASITLDYDGTANDITFSRKNNTVTDVVQGVTLTLKKTSASTEAMIVSNDTEETGKNLAKFVEAYNAVNKIIQSQMAVEPGADREALLTGDAALRNLQRRMQSFITTSVGASNVRSLADLGIKSGRDGTLSLDQTVLSSAISRDPQAVNEIFSTATTGIYAQTRSLVNTYTSFTDGVLTARKNGLNRSISTIDDQIVNMSRRVDMFRENLIMRFTAMEKVVSSLKSTGNFLTQQMNGGLNQ
jgi:flagellar hook-associated protein 2